MEFTYDLLKGGCRVATTTALTEVEEWLKAVNMSNHSKEFTIKCTNNLCNTTELWYDLSDYDSHIEMLQRRVWQDKNTKDLRKTLLVIGEVAKSMGWDPFNEEESGIHMKDKEEQLRDKYVSCVNKALTDNNVKTAAAVNKPRVSAVPPKAFLALGAAMQDGANKYGLFNWRTTSVSATVFYDAMMRHLIAWYSGEDDAPDSKQSHLAHVMANCAILLDVKDSDVFKDDRNKT